jgi:hypothetical protein
MLAVIEGSLIDIAGLTPQFVTSLSAVPFQNQRARVSVPYFSFSKTCVTGEIVLAVPYTRKRGKWVKSVLDFYELAQSYV